MQQEYKDALMLATLRRALAMALLINSVKLEELTGYVVELTSNIRRLQELSRCQRSDVKKPSELKMAGLP